MTIVKKSLLVFLAFVLIVLGLELAVKHFSDFEAFRAQITAELAKRLQADVEIDRMGLDVLPLPHLELHDLRIAFADGTVLSVPVVNLSPTLKGLFSGRPEIVSINLEEPDVRITVGRQESASDTRTAAERKKDFGLLVESVLQDIPMFGLTVYDGTVHVTAPDGSLLALEKVEAQIVAVSGGVRVSADCASALWENLALTLTYHDPKAVLEIDARDIDILKSDAVIMAFADKDLPAADIRQNLRGILSALSLKINIPGVSDPLENILISGSGSFEDVILSLPDMDMDVRELDGDFELVNGNIAATGISARFGNSRIQEATFQLDGTRDFKPSLVTAEFKLDLAEAPGRLHLIPDVDVRNEIALIKNPRGTASGTFELRAEGDSYSTEIVVRELDLHSRYRAFPAKLVLRQGTCTYRDDLLSFDGFSGSLGSSILPDLSLSFSFRDDEHFTAAAKGATISLGDLRMVLDSFDSSQALIENISASPDGRVTIESLAIAGPLTKPESWAIAVEALLDDVSIAAAGLDGPVAINSAKLKADQKACTLSEAQLTYLDAKLAGSCTFDGYFDGIHTATADVRGMLEAKALNGIQGLIDLPAILALRAPVTINKAQFAWSREGATTVVGDFVLGGKSKVNLNLTADSAILDIKELTIRDAASQCKLGIKIEEDLLSLSYAGTLKKDTLDRVLLNNRFLQGWVKGDINVLFNQKNPRGSSANGKLAWEKFGYPALDTLPFTFTSAEITAQDKLLTIGSAGLSAGQDSAGVQGSIGFADDGFVLDLALDADSVDVDAITNRLFGDKASSEDSSAEEFWETPLRGTVRFKARELKKDVFTCMPFDAIVSFADRSITVNTEGTKLCSVALPATLLITPDLITLDVQPRVEQSPMQEVVRCLSGERDLITGTVDIDCSVWAQAKPDVLLDSLEGDFSIHAQDGRIYKSGLIAKIVSLLSLRNLLSFSVPDMVKSGYAYQSLDVEGDINGQVLEVGRAVLISSSFTLVVMGTIDLESDRIDLDALVTPFQIQNQILSKIPLVGGWLSKPMLGVPLKIDGVLGNPQISTRTTSAVTKGLLDITKGIIKLPVRIISPVLPKKSSDEE